MKNWKSALFSSAFACSLVLTSFADTNCVERPSGLIAWWPGDGVALDIVGTNHATLQNGVTYATGNAGAAFTFDGSDDRAFIPESTSIDLSRTSQWTIEAWIKPSSVAGQWPTIYSEGYFGASLGLQSGTGLPQSWINNTDVINGTIAVPLNQWSHIALTSDGTNRTFYVDGAFAGTGSAFATAEDSNGSAIGDVSPSDSRARFAGQIDELSLYNRALASNEIASLYAAGGAGKCFTNDPSPVFLFHPLSQTGYTATPLMLSGLALGTPRPVSQWLFNDSPILGGSNNTLPLAYPTAAQ